MKKRDFNFIEITILHGYCSVHILHVCSKTFFFREQSWGTASLYRSKYRDYNDRGSLQMGKKLFETYFNILNTFSTLSVIFAWLPKVCF